jgi:hypothetical protein
MYIVEYLLQLQQAALQPGHDAVPLLNLDHHAQNLPASLALLRLSMPPM